MSHPNSHGPVETVVDMLEKLCGQPAGLGIPVDQVPRGLRRLVEFGHVKEESFDGKPFYQPTPQGLAWLTPEAQP